MSSGEKAARTDAFARFQWIGAAAALLTIAALVVAAAIQLKHAGDVIAYRFGLDYVEGEVWRQALLIPGPLMYGPIDRAPFVGFEYPPAYHLVVRFLMTLGVDPLVAGRSVSAAAAAVIVLCIAHLVSRGLVSRVQRSAVWVGALTGALLPFALSTFDYWFALMRVDFLAIALAFVGVVLAVRAARQPAWLLLAMPAFVLAVYAKQTALAAPAAALLALWPVRPRATILAILGGAMIAIAPLLWLQAATDGGFLRHIVFYNVNTFSLQAMTSRLLGMAIDLPLLVIAFRGLAAVRTEPAPDDVAQATLVAAVGLWLAICILMLPMIGKTGAVSNYVLELLCVAAIPTGWLAGLGWQALAAPRPGRGDAAGLWLIAIAFYVAALLLHAPLANPMATVTPASTALREQLAREIAASDKPVLTDDLTLPLRAGKEPLIEPFILHELAALGLWDQRPVLDRIADHGFAFVVMTDKAGLAAERFTPEMLEAIARAFPISETGGGLRIRRPPAS